MTPDDVRGLNDAARTLVEALERHGMVNLALFEQQIAHVRGHLFSDEMLATPDRADPCTCTHDGYCSCSYLNAATPDRADPHPLTVKDGIGYCETCGARGEVATPDRADLLVAALQSARRDVAHSFDQGPCRGPNNRCAACTIDDALSRLAIPDRADPPHDDLEALWGKWTAGERLAYGMGFRRGDKHFLATPDRADLGLEAMGDGSMYRIAEQGICPDCGDPADHPDGVRHNR